MRFIRGHADGPFFLYWAPYAVHTPLQAKAELVAKYEAKEATQHSNPKYAAMIESVDDGVGRIIHTLDERGLTDNTLVIFSSDNGGLLGPTNNAPLRSGKGYPYEGGIRVPLIVRWPGRTPAGSMCDEPVLSVDFLPTICRAVGASPPADRIVDGRSLVPLLTGGAPLSREAIFWHFPHYRGKDVVPYSIIRAGDWKLIKRYEGQTYELFNLRKDIGEQDELAAQEAGIVEALNARLEKWLESVDARLPKPNPAYKGESLKSVRP